VQRAGISARGRAAAACYTIALRPPFAEVPLRLQAALDAVYAEARYDEQLNYQGTPPLPARPRRRGVGGGADRGVARGDK
jgi:hypothetical protein